MLIPLYHTVCVFMVLIAQVTAAGRFLQPWTAGRNKDYSDNLNYAVGVQIITQWTADFSDATIDLVQDNRPGDAQGGPSANLERSYNQKTLSWKVTYAGLDPTFNNVFYLSVSSADGSDSLTSHYFNISNAESTSAATAAAATSSVSPSTSPTSQSPPPPATVTVAPSNSNNNNSNNDDGLPTGAIAGVAIGSVLGTLLLVGAAWWLWKRRADAITSGAQQSIPPYIAPPFISEPKPYEMHASQVHEMNGTAQGRMFELQDTERGELEGRGGGVRR
ncbi:hypothetical protein XANCAGTX0491_005804 [Xanthoria calcicola]